MASRKQTVPAFPLPKKPPKEKAIETKFRKAIEASGGEAFKFSSPARRSVPDRLVLMPLPPWAQEFVSRFVYFVELKRPGKKATPQQEREHARLRALGYRVDVRDNVP